MTEVNRRDMIGAAGAAMALAACAKGANDSTAEEAFNAQQICIDIPVDTNEIKGTFPDYKQPYNGAAVGSQKPYNYKGKKGFLPQYDFLAYIKFFDGKLKIRTAFFKNNNPADPENLVAVAARFTAVAGGKWPTEAKIGPENFDDFGFAGQTRLYFFIDNGKEVIFDEFNKLTMTMYKAKDQGKKKKLNKDNSFWNIQVRDSILSAENWYAYEDGKVIKDAYVDPPLPAGEEIEFSMNIHLLMNCVDTGNPNYIPIVIDPDGTNGIKKP